MGSGKRKIGLYSIFWVVPCVVIIKKKLSQKLCQFNVFFSGKTRYRVLMVNWVCCAIPVSYFDL